MAKDLASMVGISVVRQLQGSFVADNRSERYLWCTNRGCWGVPYLNLGLSLPVIHNTLILKSGKQDLNRTGMAILSW